MKVKAHHHWGIAGMFVAVSLLYYFGLTSQHSAAAGLDCSTASSINVPVQECVGLVDLYNNMNGPTWYDNTNWDTDVNVCSWYGVSCTNILGQDHVTDLTLNNNQLSGANLPASMSGLIYLSGINLSNNTIKSSLPSEWSSWSNISFFAMNNAQLTGTFPASWSDWGDTIQTFQTTLNQIHGILPTEWDSRTNIENFNVSNNQLTGTLPSSWSTWISISGFNISTNTIQGQLPTSWSSWSNIENFTLGSNNLTGSLPTEWSTLTSLRFFDASSNTLNGTLPASWSALINLEDFNVINNTLSGFLPTSWSALINLKNFFISYNQFTGSLPSEWSTWTSIESFDASASNLRGILPTSWSSWSSIKNINISLNNITGALPSEWSTWNNVSYFSMYANQIGGTLPVSWSGMTSIRQFYVSQNNISGPLPASWSTWTGILSFNVSTNNIEGNLPASWSTWTDINDLRVTQNELTGSLPASWSGMTSINTIWLSNNLFEGEIPVSWTTLTTLYNSSGLVLDNNCLETDLPEPPASFVETKAGTGWESSQNLCLLGSDLVITKTNSTLTGIIGTAYTYSIHYINSGDSAVSNVTIRDTLITGLSLPDYDGVVSDPVIPFIYTGRNLFWNVGTLAPMQSGNISVTIFIGGTFVSGDTITNTATITGNIADLNWLNNSSTTSPVTLINFTGDASIIKDTTDTIATAGDIISYTIEFANNTLATENTFLEITDTLPAELTYVDSEFSNNPWSYITGVVVTGQSITWLVSDISPNSTGSITVYAQIGGGTTSGTIISNTANIEWIGIDDINMANNSSTAADITVLSPETTGDMSVFKWSPIDTVVAGDTVTFVLTYQNDGAANETGITLRDFMQSGFSYLTTNFTTGLTVTDLGTGTLLEWHITGMIASLTSGSIIVQAKVNTGVATGTILENVVFITGSRVDVDASFDNDTFLMNILGDPSGSTGSSYSSTPTGDDTIKWSYAGPGGWDFPRITYHSITGDDTSNSTTIAELGAAPSILEDQTCIYKDGDFEKFKTTFKDIQNSIFKSAVDTMLDYCLVQGEYNQGKMFGVYNYVRWGEAYKMFGRLAGLSIARKLHPTHWSDSYRFAGMKLDLWASISSQPHNPKSYISYADIFTIANNILKYYNKPPFAYDPTLNYNNAISRGKFALFMQKLIYTINE